MTPTPITARQAAPLARTLAALLALASPAALALLAACSSPDPTPLKAPTTTGNEKRDTEIKHESCDGNASSALRVDANGDGKADIIHVMNGPREVCRIVDLNLDGSMDAFVYYEPDGVTERRRESDFDRDGRPDEIAIFQQGIVVLKMRETNFDNKLDTWDYYEGGRLVKRERDSNGDGNVDQWWSFNNPTDAKCAIVAADRNGDGKPDPESVVDLCGETYGTSRGAPGLAPGATAAPSAPAPGAPGSPGALVAPPGTPPASIPSGLLPPGMAPGLPPGAPPMQAPGVAPPMAPSFPPPPPGQPPK
jgi:hypothetical protein